MPSSSPRPRRAARGAAGAGARVLTGAVGGAAVPGAPRQAIVAIDAAQRIAVIDSAAARMLGCDAAQAVGSEFVRIVPERMRRTLAARLSAFAASGEAERSLGERVPLKGLRANGEEFALAITLTRAAAAPALGEGACLVALLRDLGAEPQLRLTQDALRRRFEIVFEWSPNAVWIAEGERIVFANRACERLFGAASRESLIGRSVYSLLAAESHDAVRGAVARALATGEAVSLVQERIARLDGDAREVEIALAPLPDHGRTTLQMVIGDITQLRREAREARESQLELRGLSARLVEAREDERQRIARELHDELGQRLTALKLQLAGIKPGSRTGAAGRAAMLEMLDDTVASVRRIAADLRPLMLDDLGFNAAVEWLARDTARRMAIEVALDLDDDDPNLDERSTIALYRMVQEALTNVARHARASEVRVSVREREGRLFLVVRDDGVGFAERATAKPGSFGLMGMRERVRMLGGEMQVDNPPEGGARITVQLPLAGSASRAGPRAAR